MADELIISYANDIQVKIRHNQEIRVELTKQGPQGPEGIQGEPGVVTVELEALRAQVIAARDTTDGFKVAAAGSATAAKTSETNSKTSQTAAKTSETNSKTSETAAAASQTAAKTSETNSKTSETNAASSKTAAAASQTAAKTSETNSKTSETNAAGSASASALSENNSALSAAAAKTSETNSKTSETNAAASKTAAATSQTAAKTSETNSKASETAAASSNTLVQAAKTAVDTAKTAVDLARDVTVAAKNETVASLALTNTARDEAVVAKTTSQSASGVSVAARNEAEVFADAAALSATKAATFDPGLHILKANNGSDFPNAATVRTNIGAQAALSTVSQAEAEAGTATTTRNWTAQRVKQAHADKAPLASPVLTGVPTAPTATHLTNTKQIATTEFVRTAIAALAGTSPEALDTIQELATALGNDPNFATTVVTQLAGKADKVHTHVAADITDLPPLLNEKVSLQDADKRYAFKQPTVEPTIDLLLTSAASILPEWFTRASRGTYFDAMGVMRVAEDNEPRFDFDPATGEAKGLLIEAPSTNFLARSDDMLVAPWVATRLNTVIGPLFRGVQMFRLTPDTSEAVSHQITNNFSLTALPADTAFTASFIIGHEGGNTKRFAVRTFDSIGFISYIYFDIDETRVVGPEGVIASIVDIGDGLRSVTVTFTARATSTSTGFQFFACSPTASSTTVYNHNGVDSYLIGAPQMEQATYASSYIPTTAAAATRAVDTLTVPLTSENFSGRPMTIYSESRTDRPASAYLATNDRAGIWCLKGTAAGLFAYYSAKIVLMSRTDAAVFPTYTMEDQLHSTAYKKIAVGFDGQGVCRSSVAENNIVAASTLQFPISNMNRLLVGDEGVASNGVRSVKGHLRRISVYPAFLSDDELMGLTR